MAETPDLFDVKRKYPRKKQPQEPGTGPALAKLFAIYRDGYERRFREPPLILKQDGPLLKKLVTQFGLDKVEARLRAFLAWDDPFIVNSGFAISVFYSSWNRLAASCAQQEEAPRREPSVERTSAYLTRLRSEVRSARQSQADLVEVFNSALQRASTK